MSEQAVDAVTRAYRPGDEEQILKVFRSVGWGFDASYWLWKYKSNPQLTPSSILLAERSDRVVGCVHGFSVRVRLGTSTAAKVHAEGDWAVVPEYQRKGLLKNLMSMQDLGDAVLRRGFSNKSGYRKIYSKLGYTLVPGSTRRFERLLTARPLAKQLSRMFESLFKEIGEERLRNARLVVLLVVAGLPDATLCIREGRVMISDRSAPHPDVTIFWTRCSYRDMFELTPARLFTGLLTGRTRVRGSLMGVYRLLRLLLALRSVALFAKPNVSQRAR